MSGVLVNADDRTLLLDVGPGHDLTLPRREQVEQRQDGMAVFEPIRLVLIWALEPRRTAQNRILLVYLLACLSLLSPTSGSRPPHRPASTSRWIGGVVVRYLAQAR